MKNQNVTTGRIVTEEDIELLDLVIEFEELKPDLDRGRFLGHDYMSAHDHLRWLYGSAREHRCIDCGKPAHHWSLDHYEDAIWDARVGQWWSKDICRYAPRCARCHGAHDRDLASKMA